MLSISPPRNSLNLCTKPPTTPTPSSSRQLALASCINTLTTNKTTFINLSNGIVLRNLLRDAGFPCNTTATSQTSSSKTSQSGQSSAGEVAEETTNSLTTKQNDAVVLLQVRDQIELTLHHSSGELITVNEIVLARRGSTTELARIVELVLVCCCVHGTKREAHINLILSLDVSIQAEIMDVIHFHVGVVEEDEEEREERAEMMNGMTNEKKDGNSQKETSLTMNASPFRPTPSPLAAKFRRLTRDMSPGNPFAASPSTNSPLTRATNHYQRQERRRDSMDSLMSETNDENYSPFRDTTQKSSRDTTGTKETTETTGFINTNASLSSRSSHSSDSSDSSNSSNSPNSPNSLSSPSHPSHDSLLQATFQFQQEIRSLKNENAILKDQNINTNQTLTRQSNSIKELRNQLDVRTKESHRREQDKESRNNVKLGDLEDDIHTKNQLIQTLKLKNRRNNENIITINKLKEENSILNDQNKENLKLRSSMERAKRRLELLPVLKKELSESRSETTEATSTILVLEEELKNIKRELPRLKLQIENYEIQNSEMVSKKKRSREMKHLLDLILLFLFPPPLFHFSHIHHCLSISFI